MMLFRRRWGLAPLRLASAHLRCARPHRPEEDISTVANMRTFLLWSNIPAEKS
jgi:hypothetical protein